MSTDHKDLIKRLVEAPFGKSEGILKSEGCWNDRAAQGEGEVRKYKVCVYGEIEVKAVIYVEATSEEEAEDFATDDASSDMFDWGRFGKVQITGTDVLE